ncbi:hypothetical protein ABK040_007159 [Willaertia magna]
MESNNSFLSNNNILTNNPQQSLLDANIQQQKLVMEGLRNLNSRQELENKIKDVLQFADSLQQLEDAEFLECEKLNILPLLNTFVNKLSNNNIQNNSNEMNEQQILSQQSNQSSDNNKT